MNQKVENRTRWLVDRGVQIGMLRRVCVYWVAAILFVSLPIALIRNVSGSGQFFVQDVLSVWKNHWPVLACLTAMLPFALNDLAKFSNRFAGPIFRLKNEMQKFEQTGESFQLTLREHDYWKDVVESYCAMTQRIETLEKQLAEREPVAPSDSSR